MDRSFLDVRARSFDNATPLNEGVSQSMPKQFENLTASPGKMPDSLEKALVVSFGSIEEYIKDLKASAGSTPGWVLTTKNKMDGKLHNYIMFEHHIGLPAHQGVGDIEDNEHQEEDDQGTPGGLHHG